MPENTEAQKLKDLIAEAKSTLSDVLEYLEDNYDVIDGPEGEPRPNKAMILGEQVERIIRELGE